MMKNILSVDLLHLFLSLNVFMMKYVFSAASCSVLGQLENGRTFFRYGGIYATFACNPGFSLLGHVSNSCIRGRWRKTVPVCVASGCHLPSGTAHGSLRTSYNNAVITFMCNKGYKLFGSSLIYCDGKRWNNTIPICRESDMMGTSLRNNNSETSSTIAVDNSSLFRKSSEHSHRILYKTIQNGFDNIHKEIFFRSKDIATTRKKTTLQHTVSSYHPQESLKLWEHQRQLQSPGTYLSVGDERKSTTKSNVKDIKASMFPSIIETHTVAPNINITTTNWYSRSSTVTKMEKGSSTAIPTTNETSKVKAIPSPMMPPNNRTLGSLRLMDPYSKHENYVTHGKKAFTSLYIRPESHLAITPAKATETTTLLEYKTQSNSTTNHSSIVNLLNIAISVVPENISQKTPNLLSTYDQSKRQTTTKLLINIHNSGEANAEIEANATTPIQPLTSITSSIINYTETLPVSVEKQATENSILPTAIANTKGVKTTYRKYYEYIIDGDGVNFKQIDLAYKVAATQNSNHVKVYSTQKMSSRNTPANTSPPMTALTTNTRGNHMKPGTLKKAFKRRVQCTYPPVPKYGTFQYLPLQSSLPNQYQYYIQYSCYPGYTMSLGNVYSFCTDTGSWSGVTPVCNEFIPCSINNGGCSQICKPLDEGNVECGCTEGFVLLNDTRTCRDLDECSNETPVCDQVCSNTFGSYKCSCWPGYSLAEDSLRCIFYSA